jgi:hypothetical protein
MTVNGELIQPLTLDINAYKRRFNSLVNLNSFERANKRALENKRAAWAAYRPLATEQLYDTLDNMNITILNPFASRAPRRSTVNGVLYGQTSTVHRPTEHLAIAHALGLYRFDSDDPVVRQDPHKQVWWCISCETFKPLTEFARDKDNVHGLAFACKRCQDDAKRRIYKRAA